MARHYRKYVRFHGIFDTAANALRVKNALQSILVSLFPPANLTGGGTAPRIRDVSISSERNEDGDIDATATFRIGWIKADDTTDHEEGETKREEFFTQLKQVDRTGVLLFEIYKHECPHYSDLPLTACTNTLVFSWSP